MEEKTITAVAKVLSDWNPLGPAAKTYADLNDYRTEAINIIFELQIRSSRRYAERIVMEVLNQAFHLSLTAQECAALTAKILAILDARQ